MCELYCIAFIEYIPIYFLQMSIKKMTKQYITILKINMLSLEFRIKKIDETRNYL